MNHARVWRSRRLQKVRSFLEDRGPSGATTREIVVTCDVCAVNSIASELRANGVPVSCSFDGTSEDGGRIYRYRIGRS